MATRAKRAAEAAMKAQGAPLAAALDSGRVDEIEAASHRVFLHIYLAGFTEGRE
ncbi:MAG TPA: hypothetical protein VG815_05370 [Chloroflexota bacterium]|nr:hypothetical protein [Chloroflexota bacterium]